jgi:hypothetical protein
MSSYRTAILFDTTSIQHFVFGSNKLKDNLGASYIVENIYNSLEDRSDLEHGYIGGGNALVFSKTEDDARKIIKEFTTKLLCEFPGVSLSVAILPEFGKEDEDYSDKIKKIYKELAINKGRYIPISTIPSHGITDVCRFSSLSVEVIEKHTNSDNIEIDLISATTATKRNYEEIAREEEKKLLESADLSSYSLPSEFENLGQKKNEDSHIAVVHIDGNGFGEIFRNLKTLEETKKLSEEVKNAVVEAFIFCLTEYARNKESLSDVVATNKKKYLPIRPIILGGDDVTFVCHGKLGIWFAEKFVQKFSSYKYVLNGEEIPYSCCAGVAIIKEKYPFYRAYQLAESLCNSAKKKNKTEGGNWIDFQFAYSGLGNSLEEVREFQYSDLSDSTSIISRPYCFDKNKGNAGLDELKKRALSLGKNLPKSKIKGLRLALNRDKESMKEYLEHVKNQHEGFKTSFFSDGSPEKLPFFDMIELIEIYPANLLNS